MTFNVRVGSQHILAPVHIFPGDDISPEDYRRTIFNGYISSVATITGAAKGYRLDIDNETFERWKRMGSASGLLDDFLDNSDEIVNAAAAYNQGLDSAFNLEAAEMHAPAWADAHLKPAVKLLRNSVAIMPVERITPLINSARVIGNAVLDKVVCTDINQYIEFLKDEAYHSSILIHGSVSEYVRSQPGFQGFSKWCRYAIELGTLADCAMDLWADNKHGRTHVDATVLNSLRLARSAHPAYSAMIHDRPERRATLHGLAARLKFSKWPTVLLMKR